MMTWCRFLTTARSLRCVTRNCSNVSLVQTPKAVGKVQTVRLDDAITDKDFEGDMEPSILAPDLGTSYDFSDYGPRLGPTQTFAAYVNRSPTLQRLVDLGVDLSSLEKRKDEAPKFIMGLDFDRDIAKYIRFLVDIGVAAESIGRLLTKNPLLLKEDLDHLQTRVDFLMHLKFEFKDFERLVTANPFWLSTSIKDMQYRVDYFRKKFHLTMKEFRTLALTSPKLITLKIQEIEANTFSIMEEMGFNKYEVKAMLLCKPKVWLTDNRELVERFDFLHNKLKIPHKLIARQPHALLARLSHLRQRHFFLLSLGKAQYDPTQPNYVSLMALVTGDSAEFASNVAGASRDDFNQFLKTL